jgi:endonuclease/exonuclease/phosphatase family metal-dependent hydrolase
MYKKFLGIAVSLFVAAAVREVRSDDTDLVVMTYNIRLNTASDGVDAWPNRASTVAETLQQADVFGLQEVLPDQITDLEKLLPDYDWFGAGRDDGQSKGEAVPVFYNRSRLEKIDGGHFWLSKTPDKPGSKDWDAAITRMVTWVVLKDRQHSKSFLMMNTHFDHMGQEARLQSAKMLDQKAAEMHPELSVVLTGDFNCDPSSQPYIELTQADARTGFEDSLANYEANRAGPAGTWNAFTKIDERRIDFIFTARKASTSEASILDPKTKEGRFASDHLPVVAKLKFIEQ